MVEISAQQKRDDALWSLYRSLIRIVVILLFAVAVLGLALVTFGSLPRWIPAEVVSFGTAFSVVRLARRHRELASARWSLAAQLAEHPGPEPVGPEYPVVETMLIPRLELPPRPQAPAKGEPGRWARFWATDAAVAWSTYQIELSKWEMAVAAAQHAHRADMERLAKAQRDYERQLREADLAAQQRRRQLEEETGETRKLGREQLGTVRQAVRRQTYVLAGGSVLALLLIGFLVPANLAIMLRPASGVLPTVLPTATVTPVSGSPTVGPTVTDPGTSASDNSDPDNSDPADEVRLRAVRVGAAIDCTVRYEVSIAAPAATTVELTAFDSDGLLLADMFSLDATSAGREDAGILRVPRGGLTLTSKPLVKAGGRHKVTVEVRRDGALLPGSGGKDFSLDEWCSSDGEVRATVADWTDYGVECVAGQRTLTLHVAITTDRDQIIAYELWRRDPDGSEVKVGGADRAIVPDDVARDYPVTIGTEADYYVRVVTHDVRSPLLPVDPKCEPAAAQDSSAA